MHSSGKLTRTQMNLNLNQLPWWILLSTLFLGCGVCGWWVLRRQTPPLLLPILGVPLRLPILVMVIVTGLITPLIMDAMELAGFNDVQIVFTVLSVPSLGTIIGVKIGKASRSR